MKRKVRIVALPKARTGYQIQGSLANDVPAMGGADYDAYIGQPKPRVNSSIKAVEDINDANLEAEGGETAYGNLNGNGIPSQKKIIGKRHHQGGVPLNLPDGTFIYSDTNSMKIKDPEILKMFGKGGSNKSYKPADLAKQYDIDKYTAILKDPDSDVIDRKTAEIMIRNYNMKLGALALAQESKKGFPQGIPGVASPYLEANNINPDALLPPDMLGDLAKKSGEREESENPVEIDQLAQIIQQKLQQGQSPEDVVVQMLQDDTSPRDLLGAFIKLGMPQNMIEPIITQVYSQMQQSAEQESSEEEMPMQGEEAMMRYGGIRDLRNYFEDEEDESTWMPPKFIEYVARHRQEKPFIEEDIPEAEYGMPMGANPNNYEGRDRDLQGARRMFREGGYNLPKAGDGIEVKRSDLKGKSPEEIQAYYQDLWIQHNKGKKPSEQKQIYIIEDDGRKTLVKSSRKTDKYSGDLKEWNNRQDIADQYQTLMNTLGDEDVKKIFGNYVRAAMKDSKKYLSESGKQYSTWAQLGKKELTDDEIYNYMDEHQRRNYKLYASGREASFYGDADEKLRAWEDTPGKGGKIKEGFWTRIQKIKKPDGTAYTEQEAKDLYEKLKTEAPDLTKARQLIGEKYISDPKSPGYSNTDRDAIYAMQGSFQGYNDLVTDYNAGKFDNDPNLKRKLSTLIGRLERGASDEGYGVSGRISPIDGYDTDTTAGHLGAAGRLAFSEACTCADGSIKELVDGKCPCEEKKDEEPAKKCKCRKADGTVYEVVAPPDFPKTPCPCVRNQQVPIKRNAPWWLQDTIKTVGAGIDLLGTKKQMAWEAPLMFERSKPVFYSPERELANLNEQTKIAADAISQFAGAQGTNRLSGLRTAGEAANIIQRYANMNVGVANQFEDKVTDIANKENMYRSAKATGLYDKNTIANQQYRNSKLALGNQLRNYYANAITDRWKTDALNQLYPQYQTDASVGGRLYYDPTYAQTIGTGDSDGTSGAEAYRKALDYYKNERKMSDADATRAADAEMKHRGLSSSSGDSRRDYIDAMYGRNGGVLKNGGYVYADILYPFLL